MIAFVLGFAAGGGGDGSARRSSRSRQGHRLHRGLARRLEVALRRDRPVPRPASARVLPARRVRIPHRAWRLCGASSALSEAIGALMAGVVLSETSVRAEIEERFFSFRDVFAALFFFAFGLTIDVGGDRAASAGSSRSPSLLTVARQDRRGLRGRARRRLHVRARASTRASRSLRTASSPSSSPSSPRRTPRSRASDSAELVAFAGLYVLVTATIGVILMKESKVIGRRLFRPLD